jgi:hypothetical protein
MAPTQSDLDGPLWTLCLQYGSEGWGFESLRARQLFAQVNPSRLPVAGVGAAGHPYFCPYIPGHVPDRGQAQCEDQPAGATGAN